MVTAPVCHTPSADFIARRKQCNLGRVSENAELSPSSSSCREKTTRKGMKGVGRSIDPRRRGRLSEREALPLALLLEGPARLDAGLLLLQLSPLTFELVLHLAVAGKELFFALL